MLETTCSFAVLSFGSKHTDASHSHFQLPFGSVVAPLLSWGYLSSYPQQIWNPIGNNIWVETHDNPPIWIELIFMINIPKPLAQPSSQARSPSQGSHSCLLFLAHDYSVSTLWQSATWRAEKSRNGGFILGKSLILMVHFPARHDGHGWFPEAISNYVNENIFHEFVHKYCPGCLQNHTTLVILGTHGDFMLGVCVALS